MNAERVVTELTQARAIIFETGRELEIPFPLQTTRPIHFFSGSGIIRGFREDSLSRGYTDFVNDPQTVFAKKVKEFIVICNCGFRMALPYEENRPQPDNSGESFFPIYKFLSFDPTITVQTMTVDTSPRTIRLSELNPEASNPLVDPELKLDTNKFGYELDFIRDEYSPGEIRIFPVPDMPDPGQIELNNKSSQGGFRLRFKLSIKGFTDIQTIKLDFTSLITWGGWKNVIREQ